MYSNLYNYNKEPCQVSVRIHIIKKNDSYPYFTYFLSTKVKLNQKLKFIYKTDEKKKKGSLKIWFTLHTLFRGSDERDKEERGRKKSELIFFRGWIHQKNWQYTILSCRDSSGSYWPIKILIYRILYGYKMKKKSNRIFCKKKTSELINEDIDWNLYKHHNGKNQKLKMFQWFLTNDFWAHQSFLTKLNLQLS